jgi:hypothetical protein
MVSWDHVGFLTAWWLFVGLVVGFVFGMLFALVVLR